jgi:hypothetical protein
LADLIEEVESSPESFGIGVTSSNVLLDELSDAAILSLARRLLG